MDAQAAEEAKRYSRQSILRSERMYGQGFQGPGREELMKAFTARLPDLRGKRVLDIGSGLGGAAFYMNRVCGAEVTGLDVALAMVAMSTERASEQKIAGVTFQHGDICTAPLPKEHFDVVWSRDCILYVEDKAKVWQAANRCMRRDGRLFVTDFCRRPEKISATFQSYLDQCGYYLQGIDTYAATIAAHGYEILAKEDISAQMISYLKKEKKELGETRSDFLRDFSEEDYQYLVNRWNKKLDFCQSGDFRWGLFLARKK
jgi:phosphoethanolamine N-methyltransferase